MMEHTDAVNLVTICRTCLGGEANNSIHSYVHIQNKQIPIKDLILMFTKVQVLYGKLPINICNKCVLQLENAYIFNDTCLNADKALRKLISDNSLSILADGLTKQNIKSTRKNYTTRKKTVNNKQTNTINKEIKILPKQPAVILNLPNKFPTAVNPIFVIQPSDKIARNQYISYEMGVTNRSNLFVCHICSKQFISGKYLKMHHDNNHKNHHSEVCFVCDIKFDSASDLKKHDLKVHFKNGNKEEASFSYLKKSHPEKHRQENDLANDSLATLNKDTLKTEMATTTVHENETRVALNGAVHTPSMELDDSEGDCYRTDGPVVCRLCGIQFANYKHYRLHRTIHKRNVCPRCNRGFLDKDVMRKHVAQHNVERPYECAYCHKEYLTRHTLLQHYRLSHNISESNIYFCGICKVVSEAYLDLDSLKKHLDSHRPTTGTNLTNMQDKLPQAAAEYKPEEEGSQMQIQVKMKPSFEMINLKADMEDLGSSIPDTISFLPEDQTVNYIVIPDTNGKEKYLQISDEQVELLVRGELNEADLKQLPAAVEAIKPDSNAFIDELNMTCNNPATVTESNTDTLSKNYENENIEPSSVENLITSEANVDKKGVIQLPQPPTRLPDRGGHSAEGRHQCHLCGALLQRRLQLVRHYALAHNYVTKRCPYCKEKFNSTSLYEVHRKTCQAKESHIALKQLTKDQISSVNKMLRYSVCPICNLRFHRKQMMFNHLRHEHGEDAALEIDKKHYLCKLCNKRLMTRAGFSYHMRAHYGYPKHECTVCRRRFTAAVALRHHIASRHTHQLPHQCGQCERKFVSKDHLRKHLKLTHGRRRDFLCGVCGLTFQQSSHIEQHMWVHTGVKPHACRYCLARYAAKGALKKHYIRMHNEEYMRDLNAQEAKYKRMELEEKARITNQSVVLNYATDNLRNEENVDVNVYLESKSEDKLQSNEASLNNDENKLEGEYLYVEDNEEFNLDENVIKSSNHLNIDENSAENHETPNILKKKSDSTNQYVKVEIVNVGAFEIYGEKIVCEDPTIQ